MKTLACAAAIALFALVAHDTRAEPPASKLDAGLAALRTTDWAAAERDLTAAASGRDRGAALLGLARVDLGTGRYAEAAAHAEKAAADAKVRLDAVAVRAEALRRLGKLDEAIKLLESVENDALARRARLLLGELYILTGRRGDARDPLMSLVADYNDGKIGGNDAEGLALVGRAAHLLRSARDANDAYNQAEKAGAHRVETLLWRAELFLDKYDPGHAAEVVEEALSIAPHDAAAHVAMARVKLDQALDFDAAEHEVAEALAIDPKIAGAFFVRAGLALRDMDIEAADRACDQGLAANPGDLDLLSMKGAVRFLAEDRAGFERVKADVFRQNPEFSRFYQIVGEFAEWEHRYDDIVAMMREATKLDPKDGKAWAVLGLNLVRAGDEAGGLEALRTAWKGDHFNVRVFNTLNLLEKDVATDYETEEHGPFRIRYAKSEKAVLSRYVPAMLDEAWASMTKRYGFVPKTPISIELYATTESFSVRTSGLPNVGIQGVCFGKTLAAMSPKAQPFNWGNVLWHELAHVFAIQLSKNRVPRWFTEGLSEYETIVRRPEWRREEDPALYAALRAGRIPPIDHLNRAFTHADDARDVMMAYYAASQLQVYLAEAFGMPKIVAMLKLWGEGKPTPEVIRSALGIASTELDARFRAWLRPRLERYDWQFVPDAHAPSLEQARAAAQSAPGEPRKQVELALALAGAGKLDDADKAVSAALALNPIEPDALFLRARMRKAARDPAGARATLLDMVRMGYDGYSTRMMLADLAEATGNVAAERQDLAIAHEHDPTMVEPLQGLYDLAHKEHRDAEALALLRQVTALDQHDRKAWKALLEGLVATGAWDEARKVGESAMFVDVENPEVHALYARALSQGGDHRRALFELDSALACGPKGKTAATVHALLAKEHLALGDPSKAKAERDEALKLDPDQADAKALRIR